METELLYRDDAYLRHCEARVLAVDETGCVLDRTVFYVAGGGQPGDSGVLRRADGSEIRIADTRRDPQTGAVRHLFDSTAEVPGDLVPGESVTAGIDWVRRHALMRIHTSLHVLSCVVKAPVTGGQIGVDRGRLDFDVEMNKLDAAAIEAGLNELVAQAVDTETVWVTEAELDAQPELVKTMSVAPPRGGGRIRLLRIPGIDLQACGGTHVRNLSEIGALKVLRIRNEGRRNRRVEIGFA